MKAKENKPGTLYCVHYDIEPVKCLKLSADDIEHGGKIQYKITMKHLVVRGEGGLIAAEKRTIRKQVGGGVLLKKRKFLDENIINTKKVFMAEAGRKGITGDALTELMKEKGFGYEPR